MTQPSPSVLLLLPPSQAEAVRGVLHDGPMGPVPVHVAGSAREALGRILLHGQPPSVLILPSGAEGREIRMLRILAEDPFGPTRLLLLPEDDRPPARDAILRALRPAERPSRPPHDPTFLRDGLEKGGIDIRYQPIVRSFDRRPVRLEALARWDLPPDLLPPNLFMPLAERSGLGRDLSMSVVRRALAGFARMRSAMPRLRRMQLSVNLPLDILLSHDLTGWLADAMARHPIRPRDLAIELTETTPVRDGGPLRRALRRLRQAGHEVMIDDLGLNDDRAWLLDLPFAGAKLDRSLIVALPHSARARQDLRQIVRRAGRQGMHLTAEGVSSPLLWRTAASLGVEAMQGFAIGRPMLAEVLPAWASQWWTAGAATRGGGC